MRDFTINEIADEIRTELGLRIPKTVLRRMFKNHFRYIFKVMKTDSDRILMRENDIHTIYREINIKEACGKIADLDETKVPKNKNGFSVKHKGFKDPMKSQKKWAKKVYQKRHLMPKLDA